MNATSSTVSSSAATLTTTTASAYRSGLSSGVSFGGHTAESSMTSRQATDISDDPIPLDTSNRFIKEPQTFQIMNDSETATHKPAFRSIFAAWCKAMHKEGQLKILSIGEYDVEVE